MNFLNINPVIFELGWGLAITWYSASYTVGILLGWYLSLRVIDHFHLKVTKKNFDDLVTWLVIAIIIGGRLGYVLIYEPQKYMSDPIRILKTYEGGMSFHGAFIAIALTTWIYSRKYSIPYFDLTDIFTISIPIGLFLGRIANFINGELYGHVTDVSWAMQFPGTDTQSRHPSQLYEAALEGGLLFTIMMTATYRFKSICHRGLNSGIFLIGYSCFRIFSELFRVPDPQIGYIAQYFTIGQLLSVPLLIWGIYILFRGNIRAN